MRQVTVPSTVEELRDEMLKIVEMYPNNTNPTAPNSNVCLYTDYENKDRHCFIGQLLVHLGLPVPSPHVTYGILSLARDADYIDVFTSDQIQLMGDVQTFADGGDEWSELIPTIMRSAMI